MVDFNVSDDDRASIGKIVDRTLGILDRISPLAKRDLRNRRINLMMDLTACHLNGNPLRLADLAQADDFNVIHDVGGISKHIDHDTGKLTDCFLPRFSQREAAKAA